MGTTHHKITQPGLVAEIAPTDANHIYFNANTHSGMGKDYPSACWMEIRGITYGLSAHFHKWSDGTWNLGLETEKNSPGTQLYHHLWMKRVNGGGDASDAARRKAVEVITAIVRQWVAENEPALIEAQRGAARERRKKVAERIAELQSQIEAAQAEIQALDAQLR